MNPYEDPRGSVVVQSEEPRKGQSRMAVGNEDEDDVIEANSNFFFSHRAICSDSFSSWWVAERGGGSAAISILLCLRFAAFSAFFRSSASNAARTRVTPRVSREDVAAISWFRPRLLDITEDELGAPGMAAEAPWMGSGGTPAEPAFLLRPREGGRGATCKESEESEGSPGMASGGTVLAEEELLEAAAAAAAFAADACARTAALAFAGRLSFRCSAAALAAIWDARNVILLSMVSLWFSVSARWFC